MTKSLEVEVLDYLTVCIKKMCLQRKYLIYM